MSRPGTILSQTPRQSAASNMSCESAIAVAIAITSRQNSDSSMPGAALGDAVAHRGHAARDLRRRAGRTRRGPDHARGNRSSGWCADSMSL